MDIELEGAPEKVKNLLFNFSNDSFERVSLTKEAQELGQMYVNEKVVGQTLLRIVNILQRRPPYPPKWTKNPISPNFIYISK